MILILNFKKYKYIFLIVITLLIIFLLFLASDYIIKKYLYPIKYEQFVLKYSTIYEIDPFLIYSVIKAESSFNEKAQSHKNARGLMQITDSTAVWIAEKLEVNNFVIDDLYTPETNIRFGCWYISHLMNQFEKDLVLTLASYNGGSGNVKKWLEDHRLSKSGKFLDDIPFPETKDYINKVIKNYNAYKKLYER